MNVGLMRSEISKVYNGNEWKARVTIMPDSQIIAIYNNFLRNDRFKTPTPKAPEIKLEARQLTFDDILIGYDTGSDSDHTVVLKTRITFHTKEDITKADKTSPIMK